MKVGHIDVLFAVTRMKKKRRLTYKDSFKGYNVILYDNVILSYIL